MNGPRELGGSCMPSEPALVASEYHGPHILLVKQVTKVSSGSGEED